MASSLLKILGTLLYVESLRRRFPPLSCSLVLLFRVSCGHFPLLPRFSGSGTSRSLIETTSKAALANALEMPKSKAISRCLITVLPSSIR